MLGVKTLDYITWSDGYAQKGETDGKKTKVKRLKKGTPCPSSTDGKDYVFNISAVKPHVTEDSEVWVVSLQIAGYGATPAIPAVRHEMPYLVQLLYLEGVYSVKEGFIKESE